VLGAAVVTAFAFPLAASMADARTREFVLSRDADLQRFADLADGYARNGSPGLLFEEAGAYHGLYGEALAVVSTRGAAPYAVGTSLNDPAVSSAIGRALRNERSSGVELLTPWSPGTVVFAKPIGTGAQVNGAVVIVASTESTRNDILQGWTVIGVGFLAAVIGFGALALSVSRWVLRPLEEVSQRMQRLTRSLPFVAMGSGAHSPASAAGRTGPPELRALSAAFETMDSAVHTSAEAQRRLVADTAHQLRNPLAALQLRLDTLGPRVMDDGKKSHERAMGEAIRLEEILDDLLALSVAEAPRIIASEGEHACVPYLVAVERADFWHDTAVESGVEFRVDDHCAELEATISTGDLEQILDVLFDNICKYAGPRTTARISTGRSCSPEEGWRTVVTVSDDGAGVAAGELELIARRFYRGEASASTTGDRPTGTGLGLSIVEALVDSSGGELLIRETPGGGLTVVMSFAAPAEQNTDRGGTADEDAQEAGT
jgi:signal transduction histidine kinase